MSFGAAQYRIAKVETASPVRIVVQLYDGAIHALQRATLEIPDKTPTVNSHLGRAHQIISELQSTLEHDHAPELCAELDKLYEFSLFRINQACISPNVESIRPVINILQELRGAWDELARTKL